MTKRLAAHFLVYVIFWPFEFFAKLWIQVAAAMLQAQEPAHMIDAGADEVDLRLGDSHVTSDQIHRGLDAVTEADELNLGGSERPADHRHRVDVLQDKRLRARTLDLGGEVHHDRNAALGAEDPTRSERIADALIDAVSIRHLIVGAESLDTPDLERRDDVVGPHKSLGQVGGDPDRGFQPVVGDHAVDIALDLRGPLFRRRHQHEFRSPDAGNGENVENERLAEHDASCADDHNLGCHAFLRRLSYCQAGCSAPSSLGAHEVP